MSSRARLLVDVDADPWFRSVYGAPIEADLEGTVPPDAGADDEASSAQGEAPGLSASRYTAQDILGLALQLESAIADVARTRADMLQRARPQLVGLALEIARLVLRREVARSPAVVAEMAGAAIERLSAATDLRVLVHPLDLEALESVTEHARRPVGLVPDASVARGGCRVESSFGEIDAGLDAQLAEISRVLLEPDEVPEACP